MRPLLQKAGRLAAMTVLAGWCGLMSTAPAAAAESDPPLWQARELFEQYRPKMKPRELTKDERQEVRALIKLYRESADAEWLTWYAARGTSKPPRQQATLLRLIELGETGDEEAMIAARYAMAGAGMGLGWGVDAPFRIDVAHPDEDNYAEYLAYALVGHWTALIWQMHGPERSREARAGLSQCLAQYQYVTQGYDTYTARTYIADCGFTVKISDAFKTSKQASRSATHALEFLATHYADKGGKPPFEIVSVEGMPADDAAQGTLYARLLKSWKRCDQPDPLGMQCGLTEGQRAWVQHYAETHNRLGDLYGAEELARQKADLDRRNAEFYARQAVARERAELEQRWNQRVKPLPPGLTATTGGSAELEALSARLGDEYLEEYAARFAVLNDDNLRRLCRAGSPYCSAQQDLQRLRMERYAEEERERRAAASAASRAPVPSASVNVRSYDQNGNYLGTQSMTRGEAELRGAK